MFIFTVIILSLCFAVAGYTAPPAVKDASKMVGQPVDIASSAYQYRADRKASDNPPESWIALLHYAKLPLNQTVDRENEQIKRVLCALLWEEIRPIDKLELSWPSSAPPRPAPELLKVTTLDNQGSASSWWNNLAAVEQATKPVVSSDGRSYTYDLKHNTCGIVLSVVGPKPASEYDVPSVRVLVADTWKKMDIEIEWAFEKPTAQKDYSGRAECYDGILTGLQPLNGDTGTSAYGNSWSSMGKAADRRGIKASLLYMGTSKWREQIPFTSQREDVARTIVTLWTKSGNFSFLAADLENGPIYAPEYGFFIRRTSKLPPVKKLSARDQRSQMVPLTSKMNSVAGNTELVGWGSDETPWFGGNPTNHLVSVQGIEMPAKSLAMHPGQSAEVAVGWRSSIKGSVKITASVAHAQTGSDGIEWWITHDTKAKHDELAHGATDGTGSQSIPAGPEQTKALGSVKLEAGDVLSLVVGRKGSHVCDTTLVSLVITEVGGRGRTWNLTQDVLSSLHAGNPHSDTQGNAEVWQFAMQNSAVSPGIPSHPPISLASKATSARAFLKQLKAKELSTIRQQTRGHEEQSWEGAVTAMCGENMPPHPTAPADFKPAMQISVPSERMTAQWNLGNWHLLRHAQKNPANGRLWFDDYPYGILGAETYMVLMALDLFGSHNAAADGLDQWLSLPLDTNSVGHNPGALPDRPNGLFTDGHGCLTNAIGPDGAGGQMDGIHAFGPGSIGLALTEHYWMTGDKEWLKTAAPRIQANAEWMLRQRQVNRNMLPGGDRLWCNGLQPALQVTPDSGGLWMQFYECEAYYWSSISRLAATLSVVDPEAGAKLTAEAESYRKDLRAAVERSIALSPVVPVRDGTYHSVIPFSCYVRGLSTGAWGWLRDGSGSHVGPMYWETVQSAAALISPAGLLPADDMRVQGYLDVLEDRLLLENAYVAQRAKGDWFMAGWQYQGGLERTANMHLAGDDVPVFLRSFFNCYAIDLLPYDGYIFNEHAVHGPPDKIFEEAAFLERFRNLLVMEEGQNLWLARATPRVWLEQGKRISVKNAPTHFGEVSYVIVSDVDHNAIRAEVDMPMRAQPATVKLRLRHPKGMPIKAVLVNGQHWLEFDSDTVRLHGLSGRVTIEARY
ncbi:MAG: hypothetical protein ACYC1M_10755 [Armatimonadota bacterium]